MNNTCDQFQFDGNDSEKVFIDKITNREWMNEKCADMCVNNWSWFSITATTDKDVQQEAQTSHQPTVQTGTGHKGINENKSINNEFTQRKYRVWWNNKDDGSIPASSHIILQSFGHLDMSAGERQLSSKITTTETLNEQLLVSACPVWNNVSHTVLSHLTCFLIGLHVNDVIWSGPDRWRVDADGFL